MRLIKMLGLVALVTATATMFIGASTATAGPTALCTVNVNPCPVANIYTGHVEWKLKAGTTALFLTSLGTFHCKESTILKTALGLGNPADLHVSLVTLGMCVLLLPFFGEHSCTTTFKDALALLLRTAANLGEVKTDNADPLIVCNNESFHCRYTGIPVLHIVGGKSAAHPLAERAILKISGAKLMRAEELSLCPSESLWHAEYNLILPLELYITE